MRISVFSKVNPMTKLKMLTAASVMLVSVVLAACNTASTLTSESAPSQEPTSQSGIQLESVEAQSTEAMSPVESALGEETPIEDNAPATGSIEDLFPGEGPWAIPVDTRDGITLSATVYGMGTEAIILAPMYTGQQAGWAPFATAAAEAGYRVITFDFRGFGQSGGEVDLSQAVIDLGAIVDFAQNTGFSVSAIAGAGEGGTAALQYTIANGNIPRLIIMSSSYEYVDLSLAPEALSSIAVPTLWIAARQDMQHDVIDMSERVTGELTEIWIYEESSLHGTYLLEGLLSEDVQSRLLAFLQST